MPCYFFAEVNVQDADEYRRYADAVPAILDSFGARFLAKGGATVALKGAPPEARIALVEFPDLAAAEAFWTSPEFQAIVPIRDRSAQTRAFLIDGGDANATG